jgi:hypothetical protein
MRTTIKLRRASLALCIVASLAAGPAIAQSTTGSIFGQVTPGSGDTVVIEGSSGTARSIGVDANGHYTAPQLPLGTYKVTLQQAGTTVQSRDHITLKVGGGTEVSFMPADAKTLAGVSVDATTTPPIDVSTVDSRTVVTAAQLAKLPLARSAEAAALLAPGVAGNSGGFTGPTGKSLVTFGGSAASENAYYINGFNTTDSLNALGGLTLPYGSIDQEEVYTGGYSAMYGRSDGGVINQVGKRGTDEWHFGAQVLWEPKFARADANNTYYENGLPDSPVAGGLYSPNRYSHQNTTTTSAYVGGPLIKDKLFFFFSAEQETETGNTVNSVDNTSPYVNYKRESPRWYGKLDWNINASNTLELTGVSDKRESSGTIYDYDYPDRKRGDFINYNDNTKTGGDLYVAKYTSYITDNLTLSATYGKMKTHNYDQPGGYDDSLTYVSGSTFQNPALNGGNPIGNNQVVQSISSPNSGNKSSNLRIDLSYILGSHTISIGIDNQRSQALDQGSVDSADGYNWSYGKSDPNTPIVSGLGVPGTAGFPNGEEGYYVQKNVDSSLSSVTSSQHAQYIEDKWQVSDRWLLQLGLRNDQFTNYNPAGEAYVSQHKPQWAPRLGFSWDVLGDSSFKVFGNAGRYYLGLPLGPAIGAATSQIGTSTYYTYSGIAADGTPTGLTPISGAVSSLRYFGQLPDARTVASKDLKAEYQDEFILGFTKTLGADWTYGVRVMRRDLRNAIDDFCDVALISDKAAALGYDANNTNSCYIINPGRANTFTLVDANGQYVNVPLTNAEAGFPRLKRQYYSAEFQLEHPFDGTWYGNMTYVFSRSYGNTEGQLRSDIQQGSAAISEDWDDGAIMQYANGPQNNDHTHQIKFYGYYQITPEWLVSSSLNLTSGAPKRCLGYYGEDREDFLGYGSVYHFCNGEPSPPGKQGRMPWMRQIDLGLTYRPAFAEHKLAFNLSVFNLLNGQAILNQSPVSESAANSPNPLYTTPMVQQTPRYARLSVSYDY